jgi:hypothetical protein
LLYFNNITSLKFWSLIRLCFFVNTALPTLKTLSTEALLGRGMLYFMKILLIDGVSFNDKSNLYGLFDKYVDISFSMGKFIKFLFYHGKNYFH